MAHTKAGGSTKLGRDSQPKYLGVKRHDGERVRPGSILVRQRGTKILPGAGVKRGSDDTLYALKEGIAKFTTARKIRFDGSMRKIKRIEVISA